MKLIKFSVSVLFLAGVAWGQYTFFLIDNFETGKFEKWYKFGDLKVAISSNPTLEISDTISESCGDYSLGLFGRATNWYVGGVGTDLNIDASPFTRFQIDISGGNTGGKVKIELFDDDNNNFALEQDPNRDWLAVNDDKWVAEVPVLGPGFTRVSIPFSAFRLENPGFGDGEWNPHQKNGSGGLLKIQLIFLANSSSGEVQAKIDNVLLTH